MSNIGFLSLSTDDRKLALDDAALRLQMGAVILEKDFWVSWLLRLLFAEPVLAPHLVFKGGTSLSKVFGVIDRFSEDIDLCLQPEFVGADTADFDALASRFKRDAAVLEMQRLCGEKATILHSEFHRPAQSPTPDRYARHYFDMVKLLAHPRASEFLADRAQCARVVDWKSRVFARAWARYDLAKPGSFRLEPPVARQAELAQDYATMRTMFMTEPPSFFELMQSLKNAEHAINHE